MSDEQDKLKLSLEAPKLFGRKKKAAGGTQPAEAPAKAAKATKSKASESAEAKASESKATAKAAEPEEAAPAAAPEPAAAHPSAESDAAVTGAPDVADDAVAAESPDAELADTAPAAEATPVDVPVDAEPTVVLPAADETQSAPAATEDEPTTVLPETSRDTDTDTDTDPDPDPDPDTDAATDADTATETTAAATPAPAPAKSAAAAPATAGDAEPKRSLRERLAEVTRAPGSGAGAAEDDGAPLLTVYRAAALTGLIVGVALVVLTWLALRGCEAVRGTSSCGGGPGFLLLIATFAVCVYLGATLLRTFVIPDPGSSSFLAVGLVAVVSLLFLIDALGHWSMIIVIPVLSIGSFLASVWVTKTFVEPTEG